MATWNSVTHVVRAMAARDDTRPAQARGRFTVSSESDLRALRACLDDGETRTSVQGVETSGQLASGQTYWVAILPRVGLGVIAADLEALLKSPRARVREPASFYLLGSNESSVDAFASASPVGRYRVVLQFVALLEEVAAFLDTDQQQLVFIDAGRFDLPLAYGAAQVGAFSLADVQAVLQAIPAGIHERQCRAILASAVVAMTRDLPPAVRFERLLLNAAELKKRYDDGYDLFASGFSYDKVHDQVEAARVEYAGKIHKALGDIQNQLLGIPVATVIVATQMKMVPALWGYEFWLNTSVLVGCWVFAILILLLLRNQSQTLDVLADEIRRQGRLIETQYQDVADSFAGVFGFLNQRLARQRTVMRIVDVIVGVGLVLAHVVYLVSTPVVVGALMRAVA